MKIDRGIEHAASIFKVGKSRIYIQPDATTRVKEAITKDDIRALIKEGAISKRKRAANSRSRARVLAIKKSKGRRSGHGKRKGLKKTRMETKKTWMNRVRALRRTLGELRKSDPKKVEKLGYQNLYGKVKGNYFKGKNYLKKYVSETKK